MLRQKCFRSFPLSQKLASIRGMNDILPDQTALWQWLGKRGLEPSAPAKFALALAQVGAGAPHTGIGGS